MIVKKLRVERNWSQEQVALFSGLSVRTIQRVESGQSASLETLKSLASVFEVDISKLTEEIKVIDKKSEHWKAQPWWFRIWIYGSGTRKMQILTELMFLTLTAFISIMSYFNPDHLKWALMMMFGTYVHSKVVSYGDKHQSWGYTT